MHPYDKILNCVYNYFLFLHFILHHRFGVGKLTSSTTGLVLAFDLIRHRFGVGLSTSSTTSLVLVDSSTTGLTCYVIHHRFGVEKPTHPPPVWCWKLDSSTTGLRSATSSTTGLSNSTSSTTSLNIKPTKLTWVFTYVYSLILLKYQ